MDTQDTPGAAFTEGFVEADGFRIRYVQAGQGTPLVLLHGAGGLRLSRGYEVLCQRHKVIALEMPGFGHSAENTRTQTMADLAETMGAAIRALGIAQCDLLGTSFGARVALWLAVQQPGLVSALVLESPAAIRPAGRVPPSGTPEQRAAMVYAHPERFPLPAAVDPKVQAQTQAFVMRVRGPDRDADLEAAMRRLATPTLVLFGTHDRQMPPELGRLYKELMPNAHLVFVYDAGHRLSAERPEAFAEVVQDFLERRDAFVINRTPTLIHP